MPYKIEVTSECIRCGLCTSLCDNFELGDDKAYPIEAEVEDSGCNQEAAENCPVKCIKITKV